MRRRSKRILGSKRQRLPSARRRNGSTPAGPKRIPPSTRKPPSVRMYGTIPLAASLQQWNRGCLAGSICDELYSVQSAADLLSFYSMASAPTALVIRILSSFLCGIAAGHLIRSFYYEIICQGRFHLKTEIPRQTGIQSLMLNRNYLPDFLIYVLCNASDHQRKNIDTAHN